MKDFSALASDEQVQRAQVALEQHNIHTIVAENGEEAKAKVLELLPPGAEVFTMSSVTLNGISLSKEINESGRYDAIRPKLESMDGVAQAREMVRLGVAPEWEVASVNAVTEDGHLLLASMTGSQLAAAVYGADKVIFVVGTQKIVEDNDEGLQRIYEYILPLESERAKEAYGVTSEVNKLLFINKEFQPGRITVVLVKERLGY